MHTKKIVITGGPGTGKSSIINGLIQRGYFCLEEISRQVTLDARKEGTDQLFLTNPLLFSQKIITARKQQFADAKSSARSLIFFDRGMPDVLAYLNFIGDTYPEEFVNVCKNHSYDAVFVLKPWKAIFISDSERYETFDQAVEIHDFLIDTYSQFNYQLNDVPFGTIDQRIDYILNHF